MATCKLRNVSTTYEKRWMTEDGNAIVQHAYSSLWWVQPRGRKAFAVRGEAAAKQKACEIVASGEFGGVRPRRRKRRRR